MCHQGLEARQEEENKARDQNPAKSVGRTQRGRAARRC